MLDIYDLFNHTFFHLSSVASSNFKCCFAGHWRELPSEMSADTACSPILSTVPVPAASRYRVVLTLSRLNQLVLSQIVNLTPAESLPIAIRQAILRILPARSIEVMKLLATRAAYGYLHAPTIVCAKAS